MAEIYRGLEGTLSPYLPLEILKGTREGDISVIKAESPKPESYGDWRSFFCDWAAFNLGSKYESLDLGIDRSSVAIEKFLQCEEYCRLMNVKFRHPDHDPFQDRCVSEVFHLARRKIGRVLGVFSWDEAVPLMAFGPGASVGVSRRRCHVVDKFGLVKPTVTGECATLAAALIGASPQWSSTVPVLSGRPEDCFEIVRGSRVTTVPKNAKTDRVIAVEPLMNMFVQKGIGACIRRRLRSVKINLDDQTRNQDLARKGSIDSSLATIDLSSASDTISRGLVEWLLPDDWVTAMKHCRSVWCVLPSGEEKFVQKFSSMGNGFTFELESLIFWALCSACLHMKGESVRDLGVYGDDLIVPSHLAEFVIRVLSEAGFSTNTEKTFVTGPFRESCGKHFFQGHDVTPLYIRKDVADSEKLLWLANSIKRLAHRKVGMSYGVSDSLRAAYDLVIRSLPRDLRKLSIPEGFGDGGLVRDFDEARPRRHRYFDAFVTKHLRREYSTFRVCNQPALTASLFFLERRSGPLLSFTRNGLSGAVGGEVLLDKPTSRYRPRVVKLLVNRWCGLGPWVAGF